MEKSERIGTMTKEKQIEEMARALGEGRSQNCNDYVCCSACPCDFCCIFQENAHILVQEGYRKASDVAREVIDELERRLYSVSHRETSITGYSYSVVDIDEIAYECEELKKKYAEDGEMSIGIAYNPCKNCKEMDKCSICELTYYRKGCIKSPTADVVEVRHGEWEYKQLDEYKYYKVTCPYCNAEYYGNYDAYHDPDDFNYCPNCGAKMDGERKEEA